MRARYQSIADLPTGIPVFPLRGAILLPRGSLPLNIFEPRYLAMVDAALAGSRIIGLVQPSPSADEGESPSGKSTPLHRVGGAGRITSYSETEDGRYLITLTGICRFSVAREVSTDQAFRVCEVDYGPFAGDLQQGLGEDEVDRAHLLEVLKTYLEAKDLKADWQAIHRSSTEFLVNTLSMISPYAPEEKQALVEAESLATRAAALVALAEMQLASGDDDTSTTLQ